MLGENKECKRWTVIKIESITPKKNHALSRSLPPELLRTIVRRKGNPTKENTNNPKQKIRTALIMVGIFHIIIEKLNDIARIM